MPAHVYVCISVQRGLHIINVQRVLYGEAPFNYCYTVLDCNVFIDNIQNAHGSTQLLHVYA